MKGYSIMKRFINIVLIVTLFISTSGLMNVLSVNAASTSNATSPSIESENYFSEAFESNGVQYFYEQTAEYTITITRALNGEQTIVYKDTLNNGSDEIFYHFEKRNSEISHYVYETIPEEEVQTIPLDSSDIEKLKSIRDAVLNNEITFEKQALQNIAEVTYFEEEGETDSLSSIQPASASKVTQALSAIYGSPYLNKYLTSLTRRGYTGYLYQHMTFGSSIKTSVLFDVLTGIGIVATAFGTPISSLLGIAAWVSAGAAGYQLVRLTSFSQWNATVYLQKEVKVSNSYPYRAFYERYLTAVTGSQGTAALSGVNSSYKSSDYDNNTTLLTKGIDLYIGY